MPEPEPEFAAMRRRVAWAIPDAGPLDAMNQPPTTSTARGEFWAEVEPLEGRELVNARELVATVTHRVRMRNVGPVLPGHTLTDVSSGQVLVVNACNRVRQRNEFLAIHCTEQVGQS